MCFMFSKNIDVNFNDLLANHNKIIKYASINSDSFSFISNLKKPYSKILPNYEHDKVLKPLEPYLIKFIVGIKKWPGTMTSDNHKVMMIYSSCKESRKILQEMPNLFMPIENRFPEDVCYYRNERPWFATISHEKMAFVENATQEDIAFLKENSIKIYD